jgi:hypothetical protein
LLTDGELKHTGLPDRLFIKSTLDNHPASVDTVPPLPVFSAHDLLGRQFPDIPDEDGQQHWVRVTKAIADNITTLDTHPTKVKFLLESTTGNYEKIVTYNEVLRYLDRDPELEDGMTHLKDLIGHHGPLICTDPWYKGSKYNVFVEWGDGDVTYESLHVIGHDDPVTCALYAKRNNLLDLPGWKQFKRLARGDHGTKQLINKIIISYKHSKPELFKYGYEVPATHQDAI